MQMQLQNGVQLSCEIIENCWPRDVVFLHGNLASRRWWYPSIEQMRMQSPNQRLTGKALLIEFPGCGESPAPELAPDMQLWAEAFCEVVEKQASGAADLVGHSTGGLIAAMMLAKTPHLFHKALLLDPVGATGVKFESNLLDAFTAMKTDRDLTAMVIGSTIQNVETQSAFFRDVIVTDAFQAVQTVGAGVLQALDGLDVRGNLGKVPNAVLVMHGEYDQLLPRDDSQALAALMPNAKFEIFAGQGHCANVENPAKLVGRMQEFMG